jgi:uncharacterized protein (UPF0305 family)
MKSTLTVFSTIETISISPDTCYAEALICSMSSIIGSKTAIKTRDPNCTIAGKCEELRQAVTRGELGEKIAVLVLRHPPSDIQRMKWNFETKVQDLSPEYRDLLTNRIAEHLLGTFQKIRLADQQGLFRTLREPVSREKMEYWNMVAVQCRQEDKGDAPALRFLKYLLAGYCMLVLDEPGHPAGTPFPGSDMVVFTGGIYYCPVREKANDVDSALCPFCPALQTPMIGYLRPPVKGSEHRKQEFIDNCYHYHNFNG